MSSTHSLPSSHKLPCYINFEDSHRRRFDSFGTSTPYHLQISFEPPYYLLWLSLHLDSLRTPSSVKSATSSRYLRNSDSRSTSSCSSSLSQWTLAFVDAIHICDLRCSTHSSPNTLPRSSSRAEQSDQKPCRSSIPRIHSRYVPGQTFRNMLRAHIRLR